MGRVSNALRKAGYPKEEIERYHNEATSGDYNNLLQVTMKWVDDSIDDEYEEEGF